MRELLPKRIQIFNPEDETMSEFVGLPIELQTPFSLANNGQPELQRAIKKQNNTPDGEVSVIVTDPGETQTALRVTFEDKRIAGVTVVAFNNNGEWMSTASEIE